MLNKFLDWLRTRYPQIPPRELPDDIVDEYEEITAPKAKLTFSMKLDRVWVGLFFNQDLELWELLEETGGVTLWLNEVPNNPCGSKEEQCWCETCNLVRSIGVNQK